MMNRKTIDADVINLDEIGWSESRDDNQIKKYIKTFLQNNYETKINDEMAMIITFIIDDLLSDMEKKERKIIEETLKNNPYPSDIFTKPTSEEWKAFHKALNDAGINGEKFLGSHARDVWNNCIDEYQTIKKVIQTEQ